MTRQQATELSPILLAYGTGKIVQRRVTGSCCWEDSPDMHHMFDYEWRVKPEPREWWLVLGTAGMVISASADKEHALRDCHDFDPTHRTVVRVREVPVDT